MAEDYSLVENVYDNLAKIYEIPFGPYFTKTRERAVELLELEPGDRLLEVGVGSGLLLPHYPPGIRFCGIDISAAMLRRARVRAGEADLENVMLCRMDAGRLAFPDATFDRVLAFLVLSVVPDPFRTLKEMIRVCKPDGRIVFANHFQRERGILSFFEDIATPLFRGAGFRMDLKLSELVRGAALEILHIEGRAANHWRIVVARPMPRASYRRKPVPIDGMDGLNQSIRRSGRIPKRTVRNAIGPKPSRRSGPSGSDRR